MTELGNKCPLIHYLDGATILDVVLNTVIIYTWSI